MGERETLTGERRAQLWRASQASRVWLEDRRHTDGRAQRWLLARGYLERVGPTAPRVACITEAGRAALAAATNDEGGRDGEG